MTNKEKFERYEAVRVSGKYNMITECVAAAKEAGLTIEEYKDVIKNYSQYQAEYIVEKALEEPAPF